jgi:predicted phage terminase large subunit-like protein
VKIKAQPGPQEKFLASAADIAIYGGAAGGGKSFALLLEALRHTNNTNYGAVIFRRTTPQIRNEGGLWDESAKIYGGIAGAVPKQQTLEWRFPSGAAISFAHLEHDTDVLSWQGAQVPLIGFDELTHFSARQFWYMLSRNRSTCGVRPYVRATCNPDPDSFVASLISWWIDQETGYAIPERSGVIRYFVRVNDELFWANDSEKLKSRFPLAGEPKSFTFIAASVEDNKILLDADPGYRANLHALPTVDRERLLKGNWKVRDDSASIIKAGWWQLWPKDKPLPFCFHTFASYDTAFTERDRDKKDHEKSAHSARTTWGVFADEMNGGRHAMILIEAWNDQAGYPELRENAIAHHKDFNPDVSLIERKASGISLIQDLRNMRLPARGYDPGQLDKETRAHLATPYFESGLVYYPDRAWARKVINYVAAFPVGDPPSADYADTVSQAVMYVRRAMWLQPDDVPVDIEPPPVRKHKAPLYG